MAVQICAMIRNRPAILGGLTLYVFASLASTPSHADVVQYHAQGVVTSISGDTALLPLNGNVGDVLTVDFSFDTDTVDTQTSTNYQGKYPALSMTVTLGANSPAVVTAPIISTQSSPFSDLWGISGCLPSCASASHDSVRLNFFLPVGSIPSDALTLPPIPVPAGTFVQFGFFSNDSTTGQQAFIVASLDMLSPLDDIPTVFCSVVEPPLNVDDPNTQNIELLSIRKKSKRVIPIKVHLVDEDGFPIIEGNIPISDDNIRKLPVLSVLFNSGSSSSVVVEGDLDVGNGYDGNIFRFTSGEDGVVGTDDDLAQFNLSTKNLESTGTYTPVMNSGDEAAYKVECDLPAFVRE